ncbi:MAG TPA: TetR/AcrR family transcriptional regulator [Chloroflexota bacterium]|nr:TetR/AcrR family transcriptional regulator [Chloroflexota bacterium]
MQAAARREQLLKVARDLFAERGYRGTSVRDIARAVGVNEGLLYHYFANKSELFAAVLAQYAPFETGAAVLESAENRAVGEVLGGLGRRILAQMREQRLFVATILSEGSTDPVLGRILGELLRSTRARIAEFLARRQIRGEVDRRVDVEAAAQAFVGGLLFETFSTILSPEPASHAKSDPEIVDHLVAVLLAGISAAPRDGSA